MSVERLRKGPNSDTQAGRYVPGILRTNYRGPSLSGAYLASAGSRGGALRNVFGSTVISTGANETTLEEVKPDPHKPVVPDNGLADTHDQPPMSIFEPDDDIVTRPTGPRIVPVLAETSPSAEPNHTTVVAFLENTGDGRFLIKLGEREFPVIPGAPTVLFIGPNEGANALSHFLRVASRTRTGSGSDTHKQYNFIPCGSEDEARAIAEVMPRTEGDKVAIIIDEGFGNGPTLKQALEAPQTKGNVKVWVTGREKVPADAAQEATVFLGFERASRIPQPFIATETGSPFGKDPRLTEAFVKVQTKQQAVLDVLADTLPPTSQVAKALKVSEAEVATRLRKIEEDINVSEGSIQMAQLLWHLDYIAMDVDKIPPLPEISYDVLIEVLKPIFEAAQKLVSRNTEGVEEEEGKNVIIKLASEIIEKEPNRFPKGQQTLPEEVIAAAFEDILFSHQEELDALRSLIVKTLGGDIEFLGENWSQAIRRTTNPPTLGESFISSLEVSKNYQAELLKIEDQLMQIGESSAVEALQAAQPIVQAALEVSDSLLKQTQNSYVIQTAIDAISNSQLPDEQIEKSAQNLSELWTKEASMWGMSLETYVDTLLPETKKHRLLEALTQMLTDHNDQEKPAALHKKLLLEINRILAAASITIKLFSPDETTQQIRVYKNGELIGEEITEVSAPFLA